MTLNTNRNNAGRGLLEKNPQSFVMMKGRITRTRSHDITIYAYSTQTQYTLNLMRFSALRSNGRRNATLKWTKDALRIGIFTQFFFIDMWHLLFLVCFVIKCISQAHKPNQSANNKIPNDWKTPVELMADWIFFSVSCLDHTFIMFVYKKNAHHIVSTVFWNTFSVWGPMILFVWTLAPTVLAYIIWNWN